MQDPKQFLFFTRTPDGRRAGKAFLARLRERTEHDDKAISLRSYGAQLRAIHRSGKQPPADLSVIRQPVSSRMARVTGWCPRATRSTWLGACRTPSLVVYPDAGHGGIFQFHGPFVETALDFLER